MADDYAGNATTAGLLPIGGTTSGTLETSGDTDWFAVSVVAGRNYEFDFATSTTFVGGGAGETLVDASGTRVANTSANRSSISLTPTITGTYYLSVGSTSGGTGLYRLNSSAFDDYSADTSTTGRLPIGGSTTGVLEGNGDTDWLAVSLNAGQQYQISLAKSTTFVGGGLGETLVDATGTRISGTTAGASTISLTPKTSGTYYISVGSSSGGTGTYSITTTTVALPAYRFFDANYGTHFFTTDMGERNTILATRSDLTEETNGFGAVAQNDPNAVAVFRFFDNHYGTHFFTASASERDTIIATRPDLGYEQSSTFYEHMTQQSGDVAVYRLFDQKTGTQFLTGDQGEYNGITTPGAATYRSDLRSEGVAFYAPVGTFK